MADQAVDQAQRAKEDCQKEVESTQKIYDQKVQTAKDTEQEYLRQNGIYQNVETSQEKLTQAKQGETLVGEALIQAETEVRNAQTAYEDAKKAIAQAQEKLDVLKDVTVDEVLAATDFSIPRYVPFEEVVKAYREAEAALQTAQEEKSQAEAAKNAAKAELEQKRNEREQAEYAFYEALYIVQDQLQVVSGAQFIYNRDNPETILIKIDGGSRYLTSVTVDDQLVDPKDYDVSEGAAEITLHPSFLDGLKDGLHIISYEYEYGKITHAFTVTSNQAEDPVIVDQPEKLPETTESENTAESTGAEAVSTTDQVQTQEQIQAAPASEQMTTKKAPKTDDVSGIFGYIGMLIGSLSGIGISLRKKRK